MIGTQQGAEFMHPRRAPFDSALIEVVAKNVDAVGATQIIEAIAIEIGDRHAIGRLDEGADWQIGAHDTAILERHAIGAGKLQVGNVLAGFRSLPNRFGKACLIERSEPFKSGAPALRDIGGCAVGAEEPLFVIFVERNEGGEPTGHSRMARERRVFGLRKFEAPLDRGQRSRNCRRADAVEGQGCRGQCHRIVMYPEHLTKP